MVLGRRRRVRVHLVKGPSLDGFLRGRWAGHYVLDCVDVLEGEDRSVGVEGRVKVPAANVKFFQELQG